MSVHWNYLIHIFRHKWFVFVAGLRTHAPIRYLLIHDWSKFLPSEWLPCARQPIYGYRGAVHGSVELKQARLLHRKRNKHHWQYWVHLEDDGHMEVLAMPLSYIQEMVADWAGAGRAFTGRWDVREWYEANKHVIQLHPHTRAQVEELLKAFK